MRSNENSILAPDTFITPGQAARLKKVSRAAIYSAIAQGRLMSTHILKRLALKRSDVLAWTPKPYAGRPKGFVVTKSTRSRMSEAQKRRRLYERTGNR